MKKRILSLLLLISVFAFPALSQRMYNDCVQNPKVEKQYDSKIGLMRLESVCQSNGYTIVEFSLQANHDVQHGVVSLSSKTLMTYKYKGKKVKASVREWGSVDMFSYRRLKFDERYQVRAKQSYRFYMVFDPFPNDVEKVSVNENGHKGFYWEGIHINVDSPKQKKSGKKEDKKKKNEQKHEYTPKRNSGSDSQGVWI